MKRQRGLGAIAAIVALVILALLAAAIVSVGTTQQVNTAQDVQSARAWQAARAGNEFGLFLALKGAWGACSGASQTLDLTAETGFRVTVYCDSFLYNEGEAAPGAPAKVRVFQIRAVACPAATCPDSSAAVAGLGYIERTRVVMAAN